MNKIQQSFSFILDDGVIKHSTDYDINILNYNPFHIQVGDENVINEIREMMSSSGELEHDLHKSTLQIIHKFASRFAEKYNELIYEHHNNILDLVYAFFDHIDNIEIKDIVNNVLQTIENEFHKRVRSLYKKIQNLK